MAMNLLAKQDSDSHPPHPRESAAAPTRERTDEIEVPPWASKCEAFLRKWLTLEHGANIFPVLQIAIYYGDLWCLGTKQCGTSWWPWYVICWVLLNLINYSLSIGVMHIQGHRKMFTSYLGNRIVEALLGFPAQVTCADMIIHHVWAHHKFGNGPKDPSSTRGRDKGWGAVKYWLLFGPEVKAFTFEKMYSMAAFKHLRGPFWFDYTFAIVLHAAWAFYDVGTYFVLGFVPMFLASLQMGYFAWLSHAPAAAKGRADDSINNVNNWMNLIVHNQGYHDVHHMHPSVHWTEIPSKFNEMLKVADENIVSYWVTLDSCWRVVSPSRFVDGKFGKNWKERLRKVEKEVGEGNARLRCLPYFGWVPNN